MLNVTVLVGNPKPNSRTLQIAQTLVSDLLPAGSHHLTTIDLATVSHQLFDWPSEQMSALSVAVAASDILVIASPTYKATFTGLLKAFLDRYGNLGLRGVTAIIVMTGADRTHALGADAHLRPLLVELGASVPTGSLYFVTNQMEQLDAVVGDFVTVALDDLRRQNDTVTAVLAAQDSAVVAQS